MAATKPSAAPSAPQSRPLAQPSLASPPGQGTLPLCTPRSLEVRASPVHLPVANNTSWALARQEPCKYLSS